MRTGLFSTFENPQRDFASAYADQIRLGQMIEDLGFDELWVAEHHFNPDAASPSSLMMLAHLAAVTKRIRLGSAAVLLPLHDPLVVAEEVATLDVLCGGRFDFGVGKGGPFPIQNKHFSVRKEDSRPKTIEALDLIQRLLSEEVVSFDGKFFKADEVRLVPKPLQKPLPTFIATSTDDMAELAAQKSYGLMGGPPFPLAAIRQTVATFEHSAPQAALNFVLLRFFHLAPTHAQAVSDARQWLTPFTERMRTTTAALQPEWSEWFDVDRLIEDSLIGTPDDIADKLADLAKTLRPASIVLKPLNPSLEKRIADIKIFAEQIRPTLVDSPLAAVS
ncbi:MAG: LLM class flavin-dependent oxidoreductase [Methylovirgula sp.]